MSTFGARLIEAREAKGIKMSDFAKRVNVKYTTYYNWEHDVAKPLRDSSIRLIADELGVTYNWLMAGVGERDKAKMVGGYGYCGRQLCCSKFLNDLDSVSINMAKNQNIALNPTKINGMCGRLLCCLKFENENYKEMSKCLPKVGKKISIEDVRKEGSEDSSI